MSRIKVRKNNTWQDVDMNKVRVRKNNSWQPLNNVMRRVNGTWENIGTKQHVTTWDAKWSRSYSGDNTPKPAVNDNGDMYQGKYGYYNPSENIYYNPIYHGIQRSMVGFDVASIRNATKGAKIEKVEIYLQNRHSWYYSGATAVIRKHNQSNQPGRYSDTGLLKSEKYTFRGQGKWITVNKSFGEELRDGKASGFGLFQNSAEQEYYGYWYGMSGNSSQRPKIRITYTK